MSAQAAATTAAAAAVKSVASESSKATASSYFSRCCVAPVMNTLHKFERKSAAKVASAEATTVSWIKEHEAKGADAASTATKQYVQLQSQLMHYRVVRLFEECRYVFSGSYCKDYNFGKCLQDARFFTQALFLFILAVMAGRRSVFSPIYPDSPLAIALDHKVNPNY